MARYVLDTCVLVDYIRFVVKQWKGVSIEDSERAVFMLVKSLLHRGHEILIPLVVVTEYVNLCKALYRRGVIEDPFSYRNCYSAY